MIRLPQQQTKKWVTSYKGDYLGNINDNMSIDLFASPGKVKLGGKMYPHTTGTVSGTAMTPVSSFITAKINDGAARVVKTWGVADSKMIIRSTAGVAFEKDTSTGIPSAEATGTGSDLITYPDETGDPIAVTEVSIPSGDGAVYITGTGNNTKWAQSFTQVQGPFKKFSVYLAKTGTPTDNLVIQIQSDTAGVPSGSTITSLTLDAAQYTSTFTLYEYNVTDFPWTDTSVQFDLDAVYHVVFSRSGSADESNYVQVQIEYAQNDPDVDNDAEDPYTNGSLQQYNGSTWARTITYIKTDTFTTDGLWTVPSGVTSATVEAWASGAGGSTNIGGGGGGAYSLKALTGLTAAENYLIQAGVEGASNTNGEDSIFGGVEALVVAGGGGGGKASATRAGGGGGAGGFIQRMFQPTATSYTVTVGSGGAGATSAGTNGVTGGNSSIDALIVAHGGGGGGGASIGTGSNGGSGGGGSNASSGGTGIPEEGRNGGASGNLTYGGGGGGASVAGTASTGSGEGAGGNGIASTISGASVSYAGGGGGGGYTGTGNGGVGGSGGGGTGGAPDSSTSASPIAGTTNTGGGGGGGAANAAQNGADGGSGIVIIRYPTGMYTATGGTITTSGSYTIHTFTTSGTFTVSAANTKYVLAKGGLSGTNGGTGGTTAAGTGDTKYAGGNGSLGTGDRGGGGGAGSSVGGSTSTSETGGGGGNLQGGNGGGKVNTSYTYTGGLYGGGGMSQTSAGYAGARGEVRVSYTVTATSNYANVAERFFGTSSAGTSHSVSIPSTVLPGELLILIISADNSSTASKSGWNVLASKVASDSSCTQTILWKRATNNNNNVFTLSASTSISYVGYRIINGGTPTATQVSDTTIDAPEHDTFLSAKYLWIAAGTFVNDTYPNNNPTAAPTNYSSFIIQPEKYNIDEQSIKGARTSVAERQLEVDAENPGVFTGAGTGYAVGGTIAVPYEAQSYFLDASFALQVEFPASDERLYLTTTKDVKFLGEEDTIWQSLWMGVYQQDALDANYPHPMKILSAGGVILVGDGNKLHSMLATGTNVTEAQPSRLVFDNAYYINWIEYTKSAVFIGLANKNSDLQPSLVCYYEPFTEVTRIFTIKEGTTIGFVVDENCYIIDKSGQMRYYNGTAFPVLDYFPPYFSGQKMNLPHRNGIFDADGKIHFLWEGQYPYPAGIWVYEDGRLYHRNPFVFDGVNLNSYGAIDAPTGWRALYDDGTYLYAGATLYGTDNSTETKGVYALHKASGVTVESENRGYIRTPRFPSSQRDTIWQRVYTKMDDRPAGLVSGSIVTKFRLEASPIGEGYSAPSYTGTWTSATTFTTTAQTFRDSVDAGDIIVGEEIIVRRGNGAGLRANIVSITGTTTRTVTIDSGLTDVTSGTMTFSVENWKVITNRNLVGANSEWLQVKTEIRDSVELEELQITSQSNQTNEE